MSEVILKFTLPGEDQEATAAMNGGKWSAVVWDFDQWLRKKIKYEELSESESSAYRACQQELRSLLDSVNLRLE